MFTGVLSTSPLFAHMDVPSLIAMDENVALDTSQGVEPSTFTTGERIPTPKEFTDMEAVTVAVADLSATPDQEITK